MHLTQWNCSSIEWFQTKTLLYFIYDQFEAIELCIFLKLSLRDAKQALKPVTGRELNRSGKLSNQQNIPCSSSFAKTPYADSIIQIV